MMILTLKPVVFVFWMDHTDENPGGELVAERYEMKSSPILGFPKGRGSIDIVQAASSFGPTNGNSTILIETEDGKYVDYYKAYYEDDDDVKWDVIAGEKPIEDVIVGEEPLEEEQPDFDDDDDDEDTDYGVEHHGDGRLNTYSDPQRETDRIAARNAVYDDLGHALREIGAEHIRGAEEIQAQILKWRATKGDPSDEPTDGAG
jgi:hypothetical protein